MIDNIKHLFLSAFLNDVLLTCIYRYYNLTKFKDMLLIDSKITSLHFVKTQSTISAYNFNLY